MAIIYDKLFQKMKATQTTEYYLRNNGISPSIFTKLRQGKGGLDARTIDKLCRLLNCQPGDIMEYIPDFPNNIENLDRLSAQDFENFFVSLFKKLGYDVELLSDVSADIRATRKGEVTLIACKKQSPRMGSEVILKLWDYKENMGAQQAIVATNGYFSEQAIRTAARTGVMLWDRDMLIDLLNGFRDHKT